MNRVFLKVAVPVIALILLLGLVVLMAGGFDEKIAPGLRPLKSSDYNGDVFTVIEREQAVFEKVPASIEAKQATIISSRILARIDKVYVRAGDRVRKGQLLIELERSDLQSGVLQAKAAIRAIAARLTAAKQTLKRSNQLVAKGLLAQSEQEKAQAAHDELLAEQLSAKQALKAAEVAFDFARINAPINGRIVDRFAEPGDIAQPGQKLLSLYNPASLRVEASVRERLAVSLVAQQSVMVTVPALGKQFVSDIEELVPAGDSGSRSFSVKARLPETEQLLPGMYALLHVPAGRQKMLLASKQYVKQVGQLDVVWLRHGGNIERRLIRTAKEYPNGLLEVVSGLQKGDELLPVRQ